MCWDGCWRSPRPSRCRCGSSYTCAPQPEASGRSVSTRTTSQHIDARVLTGFSCLCGFCGNQRLAAGCRAVEDPAWEKKTTEEDGANVELMASAVETWLGFEHTREGKVSILKYLISTSMSGRYQPPPHPHPHPLQSVRFPPVIISSGRIPWWKPASLLYLLYLLSFSCGLSCPPVCCWLLVLLKLHCYQLVWWPEPRPRFPSTTRFRSLFLSLLHKKAEKSVTSAAAD